MDYKTAHSFIINQVRASEQNADSFLWRLRQGKPPIPGELTNILLALKMVFESLQGADSIDRELAFSLYQLSYQSRQSFEEGMRLGVIWPPLLDEDLLRISKAVKSIFAGNWQEK